LEAARPQKASWRGWLELQSTAFIPDLERSQQMAEQPTASNGKSAAAQQGHARKQIA